MADDESAIRAMVEQWLAASRAGDTATVLGLMTDDAVFLVPGQKPFGKERFAGASAAMKTMRMDGTSTIEELRVLGDWAYLRSYIELTITMPNRDTPMRRAGYTLTIMRKEADGRWRLARDANLVMEQS